MDVKINAKFKEIGKLNADFRESDSIKANFGETSIVHTDDYNELYNKPSINDVTIQGHKLSADYRLQDKMYVATQAEIEAILYID